MRTPVRRDQLMSAARTSYIMHHRTHQHSVLAPALREGVLRAATGTVSGRMGDQSNKRAKITHRHIAVLQQVLNGRGGLSNPYRKFAGICTVITNVHQPIGLYAGSNLTSGSLKLVRYNRAKSPALLVFYSWRPSTYVDPLSTVCSPHLLPGISAPKQACTCNGSMSWTRHLP